MKKIILSLMMSLIVGFSANAIPVYPRPVKILQPDGTYITIQGHGDEWMNYTTTVDGYTIVRGTDKLYHYAKLENGSLVATEMLAHDKELRTATEQTFLTAQQKYLKPIVDHEAISARRLNVTDQPVKSAFIKSNFRGLVILVNYSDKKFRLGNEGMKSHVDAMMNEENYKGYLDGNSYISCPGSVHDYFNDNSYGQFAPKFDIFGPYDINYTCTYVQKTNKINTILQSVLATADSEINFANYDADADGVVDMIYFIFAGYASSYDGNDSYYLWPHASNLQYYNIRKDGKKIGRYACSTEIYGWEQNGDTSLQGIGTICHEFSHVLGYADHYDTKYGGHECPGEWDVMDAGTYGGTYASTPVGYNAYERYTGGFMTPKELNEDNHGDEITMTDLETEADAYMIKTPVDKEYFLLENRQKTKWDVSLPGTGMLIWRVDSTSTAPWTENTVNNQDHTYFQLRRACGWTSGMEDSQADAFPGSNNVRSISNTTTPANLKTYNGYETEIQLKRIQEANKKISFLVEDYTSGRVLPEGCIFYESFDDCLGTGGNDGSFAKTIATAAFASDNTGWDSNKPFGGSHCARFGNSTVQGYAITPTIKLEEGKTYELQFVAAPVYTDEKTLQVSVESGNATLKDADSDADFATSTTVTMETAKMKSFKLQLKGSGEQTIKFIGTGSTKIRFLLDEVYVYDHGTTGISDLTPAISEEEGTVYNTAGQRVSNNYCGLIIKNGKVVIR